MFNCRQGSSVGFPPFAPSCTTYSLILSPKFSTQFPKEYPRIHGRCSQMTSKISAIYAKCLGGVFNLASLRALEKCMGWNTKKGLIWTKDTRRLAGNTLKKLSKAKILGVTLREEGVLDSRNVERMKKAKNVLGVLRKLRVFSTES